MSGIVSYIFEFVHNTEKLSGRWMGKLKNRRWFDFSFKLFYELILCRLNLWIELNEIHSKNSTVYAHFSNCHVCWNVEWCGNLANFVLKAFRRGNFRIWDLSSTRSSCGFYFYFFWYIFADVKKLKIVFHRLAMFC